LILSVSNLLMYSFVDLAGGLFLNVLIVSSGNNVSNSFAPDILLWPFSSISFKALTPFLLKALFVNLNAPAENAEPKAVPNPNPAAVAIAPLVP